MISEWMDEGNINDYVEGHGGVNRLQLVGYTFFYESEYRRN